MRGSQDDGESSKIKVDNRIQQLRQELFARVENISVEPPF